MGAVVVVNERSSRVSRYRDTLGPQCAERGIAVDALDVVQDEKALRRCVKRAVKRGARLVVVGGGDGSMTTAVDILAHSQTVLGVLPLGTGNSFAQTLTIPTTLEGALDVIAAGHETRVDLGVANDRYFANFATVGLSAEVAEAASNPLKKIFGPFAYVLTGFKPFVRSRPFRVRLRSDGKLSKFSTYQLVIASGRYFGQRPLAEDASIRDGKLNLFTTRGVSHLEVAGMYVAMALGLQERLPGAVVVSARAIDVRAKPRQLVSIDGNPLCKTPVRFGVAPGALRVLVPADFAQTPAGTRA